MHDAGVGPEVDELAAGAVDQDPSELSARLTAFINDGDFLAALVAHLRAATIESPSEVADWARSQYVGAAGAIVLAAASTLLPNRAGVETLVVDHVDDGATAVVWVTETMLGGGGVVESVAEAFAADPWRFVRGLEAAMGAGNEELLSQALSRSVDLIAGDAELGELAKRVRSAGGHEDRVAALQSLAALLTDHGVSVDQSLLVALNQRVFRVGTDGRLDPFLRDLHRTRDGVAATTGIWADLRLFSLAAGAADSVSRQLRPMVRDWRGGKEPDGRVLSTSVMATLWPAVVDVRSAALEHYNRFAPGLSFDPEWVRRFCPTYREPTRLTDADWRTKVTDALKVEGIALLSAPASDGRPLRSACHELVATPLNLGYLRVYPALAGITSAESVLVARFEVRELG